MECHGRPREGEPGQARNSKVSRCWFRLGRLGMASPEEAGIGRLGQGSDHGRLGKLRWGWSGLGEVRRVWAGQGMAGEARLCMLRRAGAQHVQARSGMAGMA